MIANSNNNKATYWALGREEISSEHVRVYCWSVSSWLNGDRLGPMSMEGGVDRLQLVVRKVKTYFARYPPVSDDSQPYTQHAASRQFVCPECTLPSPPLPKFPLPHCYLCLPYHDIHKPTAKCSSYLCVAVAAVVFVYPRLHAYDSTHLTRHPLVHPFD